MKLHLRLEPKDTYLSVLFTGTFELREVQRLSQQFLETCAALGLSRILVDCRSVQGQMSVMDRWDYATFMASQIVDYLTHGRLRTLRLAYLGSPSLIDPQKFGETVAVNRGISVKATTYLGEALEWLQVERAPKDVLTRLGA